MLITGFTLWYVWKARCPEVFQGLARPLRGTNHGYMVHNYHLPTRAIGQALLPLQQHCLFVLMEEMAEHANHDARRNFPQVEALVYSYRYLVTLSS